jgi:phosphatidyl-N-methylethanolamine N-methyltransferase
MSLGLWLCAAVLLSLERLCYVWIWRAPEAFRALCNRPAVASLGTPVDIVQKLFYGFKGIQSAVFIGWCYVYGNGALLPHSGETEALALGGTLIVAGQMLNASVFCRLRKVGVFYGNKFGHEIPWCQEFPFSLLKHPQYVGTVLSIWGFFLIMRFPHADWYLLPALETVYYVLAAYFEQ